MLDPISISAAFAIAKSTIAGVQEAIQMGKDLQECSGDLIKFFEMRDTVAKAAVQDKGKKKRSDMGQALDTVMQAKALRDAEKKLKEQLIYSGQGDVWESIQAEYNHIQAERRREEREAEEAAKQKREQLAEFVEVLLIGFASCVAAGFIGWATFEFIIYKMKG
ncbi:hypothetical protein UFOVP272_49 [uncultured Caudovirales phage]|uniref:Uncharacterized protein n=1 Tax=uncultured Caudovirales phage TaxID=2100421 RepID=A0A6J5LRM5_9CAUD|nr:hypothetical protein UFOVP272_49 [uncultured Caudovirales phage]